MTLRLSLRRGLFRPRLGATSRLRALIPVDSVFVAAIENLNGAVSAEVVPGPVDERLDSFPDARHQQCVHTEPGSEGDWAIEFVPPSANLRDSGVATDHRHDAFVAIAERGSRFSRDLCEDVVCRPDATLLRNRRELGKRATIRIRNVCEIAEGIHTRKAVNGQVRLYFDAPTASSR